MTERPRPAGGGRVTLVGAGPGDPDLITVRGAEALRRADAVLYDELAAPELLALAPPDALRINVGKRGHDLPTRSQADIENLMTELAREGRRVVRLKGGHPFVFGRGGEEASACAEAGVEFEVVPGVSAAVAVPGSAGIPVTDRRHAASFAVVTGHKDPGRPAAATRWDLLARAADTLVVLMGMRNLGEITRRLIEAGRPPETPAAAVMWGATPRQRSVVAPLASLAERVREAGLGAPATVVVGEVVRLRDSLDWFERRPLFGRRVLVTRAADQADELVAALRELGADPVRLPTIRVEAAPDPQGLDGCLGRLGGFDALLFTSANAVRHTLARAQMLGLDVGSSSPRVYCVGPRTADAARAEGLAPTPLATPRFDAEGLLEALLRDLEPRGLSLLLPCSDRARDTLAEGLRAAGATVETPVAYRTVLADAEGPRLRALLREAALDALCFTSPSTVDGFLAMLDPEARAAVGRCTVAAIGRTTARALREAGIEPDVIPGEPGARALAAALAGCLAREPEAPRGDA